jgi:hypothetical protein
MRAIAVCLAALVVGCSQGSAAAPSSRVIAANGVRVTVPAGWHRVGAAPQGNVVDPLNALVVGTAGVRPRSSACQIAAYRIPPRGAVVVVVAWATATSGGGNLKPGRDPLQQLHRVRRPSFECFNGRGAAAQVALVGKAYQVNVMVGSRATHRRIADALAVARSFGLAR